MLPKAHSHESVNISEQLEDYNCSQLRVALLILNSLLNSNAHFSVVASAFQHELIPALLALYYPPSAKGLNSIVEAIKLLKELIELAQLETTS